MNADDMSVSSQLVQYAGHIFKLLNFINCMFLLFLQSVTDRLQ